MKKLKTILQSKLLFKIIFIISLTYALICTRLIPQKSKYTGTEKEISGIITQYKLDGNHLTINLKSKEEIIGHYYFKTKTEKEKVQKELESGIAIKIQGSLYSPQNNTIPNGFNYKLYLKNKHIYYLIKANKFTIVSKKKNFLYQIKNLILKRIDKIDKTGYFKTFILGDKTELDPKTIAKYQSNGISHLFSISGMHVSFLVTSILYFLNKVTYNNKIKISLISLFIVFSLNKYLNLKIKVLDLLLLILSIIILINPFFLFDIGFQFSYIVSTSIILCSKKIKSKTKKWQKSLYVSYLSFLVSAPICIYHFQSINFLSIFFNIIMIPIVSNIIFPLTFITLIFPKVYPIYEILIRILEQSNNILSNLTFATLIVKKTSIIIIIIYYIFIILSLYQKKYLIPLLVIIFLHKCMPNLDSNLMVTYLDVGQGDATFIKFPYNQGNILIDTGGKVKYNEDTWKKTKNISTITNNKLIPYFHSLGITKLNYLVLTHGDYDHMGEAINLINHFKIDKVILNCGEYNNLESKLINVLKKKKIKYYSCINTINISEYKMIFLQTKNYNNENDNSNVIYFNYENFKFLFMGDASIEKEKDILKKYNLKQIDFLKVGHHGSNTSSSKSFITKINPKYSLISVGKNNRYGHPKKEILNTLKNSNIYRTDLQGSTEIKINNYNYKIKNYSP